jgi:hypothetical protein
MVWLEQVLGWQRVDRNLALAMGCSDEHSKFVSLACSFWAFNFYNFTILHLFCAVTDLNDFFVVVKGMVQLSVLWLWGWVCISNTAVTALRFLTRVDGFA